ncbi:MAG TPA: flagellar hook protein FlgE [Syntrophorhabdaceae bacterium]|jgi:flagellar hook protein FlgE
MLSSLYSGISGLLTNSESINVIGNNIANVNTVGFKAQRTSFQDMLYQSIESASGTSQVGRGAILASIETSFAQGSFESTSSATDLAIGGTGFFMVKAANNGTVYYTRSGNFNFDADGNLTNSAGYILQGKVIDRATNAPYGVDTDINVSSQPSQPKSSGMIGMALNLQSTAVWKGTLVQPTAGPVSSIALSNLKYPRTGAYSATTTTRTAAGTGTNDITVPAGGMTGTLTINGTSIDLAAYNAGAGVQNIGDLVLAVNATAVNVTASASGNKLVLTADAAGNDVIVSTAGVTGGNIGWTSSDIAGAGLFGYTMNVSIDGTSTYTANIAATAGVSTNWAGSGLDISSTAMAAGTSSFAVNGFSPTTQSATVTPSTTSNYSSSVTVYDSLGQGHVVTVYFRKSYETTSPQTSVWEWHACLSASDSATGADTQVATGNLTFNDSGVLTAGGDPIPVNFNFSQGASANQMIDLVFGPGSGGGTTTQYPIASTTNFQTQDGYAPGTLTSLSVSSDGVLSGHYSNGQILDLYQLTLASFSNPQGLTREGGNLFTATVDSGVAYTNTPGAGGLGNINANSLEQSNVDLATEFVKMIVAQRGYQASSKVITTTDEMLQELMSIKR